MFYHSIRTPNEEKVAPGTMKITDNIVFYQLVSANKHRDERRPLRKYTEIKGTEDLIETYGMITITTGRIISLLDPFCIYYSIIFATQLYYFCYY